MLRQLQETIPQEQTQYVGRDVSIQGNTFVLQSWERLLALSFEAAAAAAGGEPAPELRSFWRLWGFRRGFLISSSSTCKAVWCSALCLLSLSALLHRPALLLDEVKAS